MQLELKNKKTLSVPLIKDYKYTVNNKTVKFIDEDSVSYQFLDNIDSTIIKLDKNSCEYKPLYDINDFVYYESKLYKIYDLDDNYNYTLHKEINNDKTIVAIASVNNLTKLPLDKLFQKISRNSQTNLKSLDYFIDVDSSITKQDTIDKLIEKTIDNHMKYSYCCRCCCDDHNSYNLILSLKAIDLKPDYKFILINRYIKTLIYHENQITQIYGIYNVFRFIIQTGSILTPALLSIQHLFGDGQPNFIYWLTWCLSLLVGLLANYISLFGLDKKYFTYEKSYHKLVSHGWQYLQLSGKYSELDNEIIPTHNNMFNKFCNNIENMLLKEAFSITDSMKDKNTGNSKTPKSKTDRHLYLKDTDKTGKNK
jgi:hypothetical protein